MAAANLIAQVMAKLDAQSAQLDAKLDAQSIQLSAQTDQLRRERRILWTLVALIGAAVIRYLIAG